MQFYVIDSFLDLTLELFQCYVKLFWIAFAFLRPLNINDWGCHAADIVFFGKFQLIQLNLKVLVFELVFLHLLL